MDTTSKPPADEQVNRRVNSLDLRAMRERVDELTSSPAIKQAVERAIRRGRSPNATSFERYLSLALSQAGGVEFVQLDVRNGVQLVPPGEGHLAQIVCSGVLEDDTSRLVASVQDAVNRLCSMVDALEDSADLEDGRSGPTITISILGGAYKPDRPLYRSAHVHLPAIGKNEEPTLAYLNEVDWRVLDYVPVIARAVFQSSMLPNMYQAFMGAYAPSGSDWDVRTRLASTLRKLELPLSCRWSFDCNVVEQLVAIHFTAPPPSSFPQPPKGSLRALAAQHDGGSHGARGSQDPQTARGTQDMPGTPKAGVARGSLELREDARIVYTQRLACLLAAAGFGASRSIERVTLTAFDGDRAVLACRFNRHDFVHHTLPTVQNEWMFDPALRFNPESLGQLIQAESMSWARPGDNLQGDQRARENENASAAEPKAEATERASGTEAETAGNAGATELGATTRTDKTEGADNPAASPGTTGRTEAVERDEREAAVLASSRRDPHEDTRALPEDLVRIFHAKRICDIDTRHFHGKGQQAIEDARLDSNESVLAAIASLEHTIAAMESACVPPGDDARARPLFCSNPLARAVVSLLDDELAVADEAQDYLRGIDAEYEPDESRLPSYFRAPDALFQAHVGLSDLYARLGDYRGAEAEANRCLALAPTTAQSYYLKANALAQQDRFAEAANTLVAGLRYAVSERDCALLYYHLALVLWKMGRRQEAVSVHVYTMSLAGEYAEKSAAVVRNLRSRKDMPVIVHASPLAATREMARARIPVAPSDETRSLVVQAAVGLSCANAPKAAAPYVSAMARYFRNDPVLADAARSIREGCTGLST